MNRSPISRLTQQTRTAIKPMTSVLTLRVFEKREGGDLFMVPYYLTTGEGEF
jgi:hypothetical protein